MIRPLLPALLPLVGSLLLLSGCGPSEGDECQGGGYVCDGQAMALECRQGKWRALPCKGALGCSEVGDSIRCDTSGNVAGDNCASSAEGRGLCRADGKAVLECRMGLLEETDTCSECASSGTEITCKP